MTLKICTYGNPVLRRKADIVNMPDNSLPQFTGDMITAMNSRKGVGLAAPQVGISRQLCIVSFDPKFDVAEPDGPRLNPDVNMPLVMINPEIVRKAGRQSDMEGCLSVPEIWAPVTRATEIDVTFFDLNGTRRELTVRGFMARVIQHELDHLNGVLFIDRMSPVRKISLAGELKRMRRKNQCA